MHVPRQHSATLFDGERGGWLRARVVTAAEGQPSYSASPMIQGLVADTIGGTADAAHADVIEHETLGVSEGVAGETFKTAVRTGAPGVRHAATAGDVGGWLDRVDAGRALRRQLCRPITTSCSTPFTE